MPLRRDMPRDSGSEPPTRRERPRRAKRILIADDLEDFRALLRVLLRDESFEIVGEATDGREAIDLSSSEKPDAVVLDLAMPTVDGLSAISQIRAKSPHTKIVVLSAFDASWMAERAMSLGADGYVQKGDEPGIASELTSLLT